jgi:hypothetical protein
MKTTQHTTTDRFTVQVNYWQHRRAVVVTSDQIGLEVTVPRCSHCPTCQSRVRGFAETLRTKPTLLHQWRHENGADWIYLALRPGQDPLKVLAEALEIRVAR